MNQKKRFKRKFKFKKNNKIYKLFKRKKSFFKKNRLNTINKIKNLSVNAIMLIIYKNMLKFNFLFFIFFKFIKYTKAINKNNFFNINLFFNCKLFDQETCLINLKKKNFFFFNKLKVYILKSYFNLKFKLKRSVFTKKRALIFKKKFFKKKKKLNKLNKKIEIYKFFFKKKLFKKNTKVFIKNSKKKLISILKRKVKSIEPKIVNCKKFFKIKKKEIYVYFKRFYFNEKVNKNKILTFFRKLKKKSTIEISNSLDSMLIKAISVFFFFFNVNYINFLIKHEYLCLNFNTITNECSNITFGSFFTSIFFSKIFDLFSTFKKKTKKYIQLFKRKFKLRNKYLFNNLKKFKLKYFNIVNFINRNINFNLKHLEIDYLTLSFFFLKKKHKIQTITNFNIFLYELFLFK